MTKDWASATHREKVNLLYRLTPVDAYQLGLVKQICVSSNEIDSDFNKPYIRLASVSHEHGFSAKIEIDKTDKSGKVERKVITIKPGADLFALSGDRDLYKGWQVAGIDCTEGFESIEFADSSTLALGKTIGSVDENLIKRAQIRRTIEVHFEKELRYAEKNIKVLSLFFIDEVAKYRTIDGSLDFSQYHGAIFCPNCGERIAMRYITKPDKKEAYRFVPSAFNKKRM